VSRLEELRRRAWRAFEARGLPTPRDEDWKYTDLSRMTGLLGENWWTPAPPASSDRETMGRHAIEPLDGWRFVLVNGRLIEAPDDLPDAVRWRALSEALESGDETARALLDWREDAPLASALTALNASLAEGGLVIEIADGASLQKPIYLLHLGAGGGASHLRHVVRLGCGAQAHIIEHYAGDDDASGLTLPLMRAQLAADAVLTHDRLLMEGKHRFHLGRFEAEQASGSRLVSASLALGGALSRVDIVSRLTGERAEAELNGFYLADGRAHLDHHTHVAHEVPNCASHERYKGLVAGRGRAVFNGKVVVHPGADGSDASQYNANLLLSRHAEVDTKPELEIYADEVQCSHGATVGQLDEAQLFYLRSRGLDADAARNVLTFAFVEDVLARLASTAVRRHLERAVLTRLPGGGSLEEML